MCRAILRHGQTGRSRAEGVPVSLRTLGEGIIGRRAERFDRRAHLLRRNGTAARAQTKVTDLHDIACVFRVQCETHFILGELGARCLTLAPQQCVDPPGKVRFLQFAVQALQIESCGIQPKVRLVPRKLPGPGEPAGMAEVGGDVGKLCGEEIGT